MLTSGLDANGPRLTNFEQVFAMQDFKQFLDECDRGPRLNQLAGFFEDTASGKSGMPFRRPVVDARLFPHDALLHRFIGLHARRQGFFDHHYHASIPYRIEEECRMALALLRYSQSHMGELLLYSLGTAEGTMARTLSEISGGKIQSLSCSPNEENLRCFMAFGEPAHASFFLGPFHRLTRDHFRSDSKLERFLGGFDFILEDTTFQMYSPNRRQQIEFVSEYLKANGILLLLEKCLAVDDTEYKERESQKDYGYKIHYFREHEIAGKAERVLRSMRESEVTLPALADAIYAKFRYCAVVWNSGNFYGFAASNDAENLRRYLSGMVEPAIPLEYVYEPGPYTELRTWLARR
jgi:hypothetical protein